MGGGAGLGTGACPLGPVFDDIFIEVVVNELGAFTGASVCEKYDDMYRLWINRVATFTSVYNILLPCHGNNFQTHCYCKDCEALSDTKNVFNITIEQ